MMAKSGGRAWVFGDNIDTDVLAPGQYMRGSIEDLAAHCLEAVDQFQWQRPDIIFTDISMPKMDGKEAARRIRQIEAEENLPPCPIVAITAHAMEGDADEILAAGIDHYLTKPVKKAALTEHVLKAQPEGTEPVLESSGEAVA